MDLVQKILVLNRSLDEADIPHAFGGALALAWCTQAARGTIDIDINLFVGPEKVDDALASLPAGIAIEESDRDRLHKDLQQRLWWD